MSSPYIKALNNSKKELKASDPYTVGEIRYDEVLKCLEVCVYILENGSNEVITKVEELLHYLGCPSD